MVRRSVTVWSIVLMGLVGTAFSATPAAAGSGAAGPGSAGAANCQVVLGKAASPGSMSPVLSAECAEPGELLAAPAASTRLMRWYRAVNYGGTPYTDIWGSGGPCDSAGYGIAWVGAPWNDRITSYRVYNNCNYSAAWENINWGGYCTTHYGSVPNLGLLAGSTSSMWVSSSSGGAWWACEG